MQDPFEDQQMNAVAPLTVLEASKLENRDARIVYSGTRQSYGRPDSVPLVETQLLKPVDVNGVNKMAGEWFHMVYHRAYGIPAVLAPADQYLRPATARKAFPPRFCRLVHQTDNRR